MPPSTTLAAVVIPVRPDLSGFAQVTRAQLNNAFRQVEPVIGENAKRHGNRFGAVFGGGVGETINSKLSPALAGVGDEFGAFSGAALGPLGAVTAGVGLLAGQAVNMGVRTAASMEQAQIGFETLLGSEKAAGNFLRDLQSFAARTPFELPGLIEASRTLLGVGLSADQTKAALLAFGNASSAVGVGQENFQRVMIAVSQSIGSGRFQTEELNQVTENGIPIWTILSRAMGKPVPELRNLASHGRLLTKDVLPLLEKQMNKDYGGAMERQSRSLSGVWSTFMDTLNIGMANVMRPLIPLMTSGLTGATNILGAALGAIPRLFSGAGASGSFFGTVVARLAGWVRSDLIPAFQGFAAQVLPAVQGMIRSVSAAFRDHQEVIQAVGVIFQGLGLVLTRVLIPTMALVSRILYATIGPALRLLLTLVGAVVNTVNAVVTYGPRIAGAVAGAFTGAYQAAAGFGANMNRAITGGLSAVYSAVAGFGGRVRSAVTGAFAAAATWLLGAGTAILNGLITGWNTVFPHLVIAAGHTRDGVLIAFRAAGTWLLGAGRAILQSLINGFASMFGPFGAIVAGFITRHVIAPFGRAITWLLGPGRNVITGLIRGAVSLFGSVSATVAGFIAQRLIAPFARAGVWLYAHARSYITGLLNGARSLFGAVSSTVAGFINQRLIGPFRSALGWLVGSGRNIINGLVSGMNAIARGVGAWVHSHVVNPITGAFRGAFNFLFNGGYNIITGLKSGITSAVRGIAGWINSHVVQPVIRAVRTFFGIKSPSTVMAGIGSNIVAGLIRGLVRSNPTAMIGKLFGGMPTALGRIVNKGLIALSSLPGKALSALSSVASKVGGLVGSMFAPAAGTGLGVGTYGRGVSQWSTVVLQALRMLGQPASWLGTVLSRMQRESGGNPRIVNTNDINWQRGTPSVGLMQVIGPTYSAYAGPFRGTGPFLYGTSTNPLANVYAGLNYALHRYGSLAALARPGGYDAGGWLPPGGLGMNLTSRPERVLDPQQSEAFSRGGLGGNVRVVVMLDGSVLDDRVHVIVEDAVGELGARIDNGIGG